jgi:hypothetical protein
VVNLSSPNGHDNALLILKYKASVLGTKLISGTLPTAVCYSHK